MIDQLKAYFEELDQGSSWSTAERAKRREAWARFETKGFPTVKEEAWKYTPLRKWLKHDYAHQTSESSVAPEDIQGLLVDDMSSYRVVFVNGKLDQALTDGNLPEGLTLGETRDVASSNPTLYQHMGSIIDSGENSLVDLNAAWAQNGLMLHVAQGTQVDRPIQVLHVSVGHEPMMQQVKSLVVVERGAQVKVVERHYSLADAPTWAVAVTEAVVEDAANLQWVNIQHDPNENALTQHMSVKLGRDAKCAVHTFSTSGKLIRNNLDFDLTQPGAEAWMYGLTLADGKELVDHHTRVDHSAAHCQSHQNYKGLYGGASNGVFNGKIMVHVDAQKTEAYQQSDSLILDEQAQVNAKPQLEIFADDVKCSHGCTAGQLNEDALFYLRARGIPEKQARAILMMGFAQEALAGLTDAHLKAKLNELIAEKLKVEGVEALELS